jgi:UDP-2,3-diacylglucosamine hydrolase
MMSEKNINNPNQQAKSVYFVSDMHFGVPDRLSSLRREKLFVSWLDHIASEASDIYIMGDMFDFWFEWKHVIPKGYIRLFGKMSQLSDMGVRFHFFTGNHDMWMFSYFQKELGAVIYRKDLMIEIQNKTLYISHGDGLGPGDYGYKIIKKLFRNPIAQWLYARFHPNFAVWLALFFSRKSKYANIRKNETNKHRTRKLTDSQIVHSKKILNTQKIDFFVFGHQHTPVYEQITESSVLFNIGNWLTDFTFLKMQKGQIEHLKFNNGTIEVVDYEWSHNQ